MNTTPRPQNPRRRSSVSAILDRTRVWYWTPVSMLVTYFLGILFAALLHLEYSILDGEDVGSLAQQQWYLFLGTALAYFAQINLAYAVRTVSVQYLWRALKSERVTIGGINAAFSVTGDPLSFFHREPWIKTSLATIIAFFACFIPITTFFAPATLNVQTIIRNTTQSMQISTLGISDPDEFQRFSYTINNTDGLQKFLGPRTIVSRIGFAAATAGNTLTLPQPAINATYEQIFYGPYVQCSNSTQEVRSSMDDMIHRFNTTENPSTSSELVALSYFATIPALSNRQASDPAIQNANLSNVDGALYASNQLWIRLRDYQPSLNFTTPARLRYLTCEMFNASYATRFSWQNGAQNIDIYDLTILNAVPYPTIEAAPTPESQVAKSYSAVMLSMASQLTGSAAFYRDLTSSTRRVYSSIRTGLANTVLLGSSDFNSHFLQNHLLGLGYNDTGLPSANGTNNGENSLADFSDQRLQDMAYVGARPLDELIPELSKNITISLLTDPLLAPSTEIKVTISQPATVYIYQSQKIAIIYPIAVGMTAIVIVLGIWVFYETRISHDTSFFSIACSTHGIHFSDLRAHESLGALPLPEKIKKTALQFYMGGQSGLWGFGVSNSSRRMDEPIYTAIKSWHDDPG